MVHCNNCTSDLNAWIGLFQEFTSVLSMEVAQSKLFEMLYQKALESDADCGDLLAYNYFSGEPITHFEEGASVVRPYARKPFHAFKLYECSSVFGARCIEDRTGYPL